MEPIRFIFIKQTINDARGKITSFVSIHTIYYMRTFDHSCHIFSPGHTLILLFLPKGQLGTWWLCVVVGKKNKNSIWVYQICLDVIVVFAY